MRLFRPKRARFEREWNEKAPFKRSISGHLVEVSRERCKDDEDNKDSLSLYPRIKVILKKKLRTFIDLI